MRFLMVCRLASEKDERQTEAAEQATGSRTPEQTPYRGTCKAADAQHEGRAAEAELKSGLDAREAAIRWQAAQVQAALEALKAREAACTQRECEAEER